MEIILFAALHSACDKDEKDQNENDSDMDTSNVSVIPKFVNTDYIELSKISRISKFRSNVGHNYSDDFESCRSMKHYFQPDESVDWSAVLIYSPVNGTVSRIDQEWAGTQVRIRSDEYPDIFFILFHVSLDNPINIEDHVIAGQQLGTHIGEQTMSDIAVGMNTQDGWKLISYFEIMTDSLFQNYQLRGLNSRDDFIIPREARDADPLTCEGEEFTVGGNLENWVVLN